MDLLHLRPFDLFNTLGMSRKQLRHAQTHLAEDLWRLGARDLGTADRFFKCAHGFIYLFRAQVTDAAGNTSADSNTITFTVDTTAPAVSTTVPTNGATGAALNGTVTLNFNENVDCTTVTTTSVTISPAVTWSRTSCSAAQAVFTPSGQANSTSYTVTVGTGVKDLAGNAMAAAYPFSYTTAAAAPNNSPAAPASLSQYKSDGATVLSKGSYNNQTTVIVMTLGWLSWENPSCSLKYMASLPEACSKPRENRE